MKKLIDNLAVGMVVLLFGIVIALIIRYNMIGEDASTALVTVPETNQPTVKKDNAKNNYLSTLESYSDVDVQVDPTKESQTNTVKVVSEETKSELEAALKADEKKDYLKKLEHYSDEKQTVTRSEKLKDVKPAKTENDDTIGSELESILGK